MGQQKRVSFWKAGLILVVGVTLVFAGAIALEKRKADQKVATELAKLEAMGIPTDPLKLVPPTADADNAAPLYRQAIEEFKALGRVKVASFRATSSTADADKLRDLVSKSQSILETVRAASLKPGCNWDRNWKEGYILPFPELSSLRDFARLSCAQAYLSAEKGDYQASMEWLRTARRVSRHAQEPTLIGMLVGIACESISLHEFAEQTKQYGDSLAFRQAAHEFLAEQVPSPSVKEGLKGEIVFIRTTMDAIADGKLDPANLASGSDDVEFSAKLLRVGYIRSAVEAMLLERYRKVFEDIGEGGYAREMVATQDLDRSGVMDRTLVGRAADLFFPVFAAAGQSIAKLEAQRRMARITLEIATERAETGKWPSKVPQDTKDPFSDQPFAYRVTEDGYKLYSVGYNRKDDGGPQPQKSDDVGFSRF